MRLIALLLLIPLAAAFAAENPRVQITTSLGEIRAELFADECPQTVANFIGLADGTTPWKDPAGKTGSGSFYAGRIFHRVIPGFMIQGGCPLGNGTGSPVPAFADEINPKNLGLDAPVVQNGDLHPWCGANGRDFGRLFILPALQARGINPQTTSPAIVNAAVAEIIPTLPAMPIREFYEKVGYRYRDDLPASHAPVRGSLAMANSGPNTNGSQFFINVGDTPHLRGKHTVFGRVVEGMAIVDAISQVPTGAQNRPSTPVTITAITVLR
jgi:cyclophilin family peptidyl-prolyl cis-trans isomerase